MSRDHRELRVFHDAHRLILAIYKGTKTFPRDEWFGLRLQMRKAAVSITANIVEGSARRTTGEYCNFLNIALGSSAGTAYLIELAGELGLMKPDVTAGLAKAATSVVRQMQKLADSMEERRIQEERDKQRPKPAASEA